MTRLLTRPEPIDIAPVSTALLIVDMQNAFAASGGTLDLFGVDISGAQAVIDTHRRLIPACRAAGIRIIYLQMTYDSDLTLAGDADSPNPQKELAMVLMRKQPELRGQLLVRGGWDWQIVDELTPEPDDIVIEKSRYSGFCRTDLADRLRGLGIRNLLMTGIATNICVESTARDAYFEEFWPIIIEDAVNHAGPDAVREAMLWNFENVFGWVTDCAHVLDFAKNASTDQISRPA